MFGNALVRFSVVSGERRSGPTFEVTLPPVLRLQKV